MQKNASGRSLNYNNGNKQRHIAHNTAIDFGNNNMSPRRELPLSNNYLGQIRSPREVSENPLRYNMDNGPNNGS